MVRQWVFRGYSQAEKGLEAIYMIGRSGKRPPVCPGGTQGTLFYRLWKAVSGPWADHEQAEELLPSLICPGQGWGISESWVQGQPWAP